MQGKISACGLSPDGNSFHHLKVLMWQRTILLSTIPTSAQSLLLPPHLRESSGRTITFPALS